jgi:polysaccharide biosynthesis protein PslG
MNAYTRSGVRSLRDVGLYAVALLGALLSVLPAQAGVNITEGIALPSTWPAGTMVETDAPQNGSSGVNVTSTTGLSQTITPVKDFLLGDLLLAYRSSADSATDSFVLRIQEVPEGDAADSYAPGSNLLSVDYAFDLLSTGNEQRMLRFDFTGDDQLLLTAGKTYAIEISSNASTAIFMRRGGDAYWGGKVYMNRVALTISGTTRDLVMAAGGDANVVTFQEAISPSTDWPETVDIETCDPATVTSGVTVNASSRVSQTITPERDMKLGALYFPYATSAVSATDSFSLSIQEVSGGAGAQTYSASTNLLGTSPVFSLASTGGVRHLLRFGFGGDNRLALKAGVTYAVELSSTSSAVTLYRRGANTYADGAAYVNRSALNYPNTRDLSAAVVDDVSSGYTYLPIPESFSIQIVPGGGAAAEMSQDAVAGFTQARKGVYWYSSETTIGVYNFSATDTIVTNCEANGIRPWFTLYGGNSLYGEANDSVRTAAGRAGFANFAAAAAARYPQVKYYEIWNEPNIQSAWTPQPSLNDYCALVAAAAPAIKAANPDAKIVGPAMNGVRVDWFEQACRQGLLEHIDYVCVHPYRSEEPESVLFSYEEMRMLIRKYAPAGKRVEIISGEWGYSTTKQVDAMGQARYAPRMFLSSLSVGMPLTSWYTWKDSSSEAFGLVDINRQPKPAYTAMQTLVLALKGYVFKERVDLSDDTLWLLRFENATGDVAYAGWSTGADTAVTVPEAAGSGLLYAMLGTSQSLSWGSSGPTITLTQSPQYLRLGATDIIQDNTDAGVTVNGSWSASTGTPGYQGSDYLHDGNTGKGTKSVVFTPTVPETGTYEVFLRWTSHSNRANAVPVTITHAGGSTNLQVDQTNNGAAWVSAGSYAFNAGTSGSVTISNTGTSGYVVADAIRLLK